MRRHDSWAAIFVSNISSSREGSSQHLVTHPRLHDDQPHCLPTSSLSRPTASGSDAPGNKESPQCLRGAEASHLGPSMSRTLVTRRSCSCCCQRRTVSRRQTQMLMFPTSTDFPTPRRRMQRVELRSWRRSLMSRGFWWSSRTGTQQHTPWEGDRDRRRTRPRGPDERSTDALQEGRRVTPEAWR